MSSTVWAYLWPVINLAGLGLFTSLAVTGFMVLAGLGAESNERSSHKGVIPSAGGLGLVAALGVCSIALAILHPFLLSNFPDSFPQLLSLIFAMACLGLSDDLLDPSPEFKFAIMLILSAMGVYLIGAPENLPLGQSVLPLHPIFGFMGAVLWVFVVVNAVNFMDGANGLIGIMLAIASFVLGLVGLAQGSFLTGFLCGVLIVSLLGFMPYNVRKQARIFFGDTGALTAGYIFALGSLATSKASENDALLYLGPILILPILTDVLLTLASRARRKKRLTEAHKEHLFQKLLAHGWSHVSVSCAYGITSLVLANIAILGLKSGEIVSIRFFIANIVMLSAFHILVSRFLERQRLKGSTKGAD